MGDDVAARRRAGAAGALPATSRDRAQVARPSRPRRAPARRARSFDDGSIASRHRGRVSTHGGATRASCELVEQPPEHRPSPSGAAPRPAAAVRRGRGRDDEPAASRRDGPARPAGAVRAAGDVPPVRLVRARSRRPSAARGPVAPDGADARRQVREQLVPALPDRRRCRTRAPSPAPRRPCAGAAPGRRSARAARRRARRRPRPGRAARRAVADDVGRPARAVEAHDRQALAHRLDDAPSRSPRSAS